MQCNLSWSAYNFVGWRIKKGRPEVNQNVSYKYNIDQKVDGKQRGNFIEVWPFASL